MTSIIKVDQIQNAAGGVPTAGDLGFDIEGSVIATHKFISPTTSDTAISSGTYSTIDEFSLTVKRNNSKMVWWIDTQQYIKSTGNTNLAMRLLVDDNPNTGFGGTSNVDRAQPDTPGLFHVWYGNSSRETLYNHIITPAMTAGSHNFKLQMFRYSAGTITVKYQTGAFRYLVQEIAG